MDRTSISDYSASDSQISNSSFSLSLPSEPPDIRNWFPSYQYESFVLDTYDDFGGKGELECEKDGHAGVEERNREKERRRNGNNSDGYKQEGESSLEMPDYLCPLSLLSEPTDLRNWFPSYLNQSPVLDTTDDSEGSVVKETEREKDGLVIEDCGKEREEKFEKLSDRGNNNEVGAGDKLCSNGSIKNKSSYEDVCENKSLNMIPDSPESSLLLSELPDIRNWFPSYVYESPVLGESVRFLPDETEFEEDELANQDCKIQKEINIKKFGHNITNGKEHSNGFLKSNSSSGDGEKETQSLNKGNGVVRDLSSWENLCHEIKHSVEAKEFPNHGIIQAKDVQRSSFNYEDLSCKKQQKENVAKEDGFVSVKSNMKSCYNERNSATTLIYRKDLTETSEAEPQEVDLVSPGANVKAIQVAGASSKRESAYTRSDGKENEVQNLGNGFVTTRKSRIARQNDENAPGRPQRILQECSKNGGMMTSRNGEKDVIVKKKALSEVSNFENLDVVGVTGRWQCPQKRKPNLGPPMKQLRLEQWVRRL